MKTILLVDDDPVLLQFMQATLDGCTSWLTLQARGGAEGLAMARREKPSVVLLDVSLPDLNGFEVCRKLKSDPATKEGFVIMLTAASQQVDKESAQAAGADDYFTKPFSPLALLRRLDELLGMG